MKNSLFRYGIRSWVCLLLLSLSQAFGANDVDLPRLARESRPAVVLLLVYGESGDVIRTGTGFFISADGRLVTSLHVVKGADRIAAKFEDERIVDVPRIIASDEDLDIAVLQANMHAQPFLALGNSRSTEIGERIAVIGSPLGLDGTLSEGIVSAKRDIGSDVKLLQITAPISPGSSGSPVLNAKGEVIGVATMIMSGGQAINFAVPINASQASDHPDKRTGSQQTEQVYTNRASEPKAIPPDVLGELEKLSYSARPMSAVDLAKQDTIIGRAVRAELQSQGGPGVVYKEYLVRFWRRPSQ